jgi:hypothetical protein
MFIREFLTNFHLGAASGWDLSIIFIFLIAVLVYGFFLGRNRMIILLLSSYFSLAVSQVIPWSRMNSLGWLGIGQEPSASLKILVFVGLILLFYFFIPRSVLSSALRIKKRGEAAWWQLFLLSIVQLGLLAVIILSFLPNQAIADFTPLVKKIFIGPEAQFIWLTLPILFVVLMRRRKKTED